MDDAMLLPGVYELVLAGLLIATVGGTAALAARRGRSPLGWGLSALVLSLLAPAVLLLLPRRTSRPAA